MELTNGLDREGLSMKFHFVTTMKSTGSPYSLCGYWRTEKDFHYKLKI